MQVKANEEQEAGITYAGMLTAVGRQELTCIGRGWSKRRRLRSRV